MKQNKYILPDPPPPPLKRSSKHDIGILFVLANRILGMGLALNWYSSVTLLWEKFIFPSAAVPCK